MNIWINPWHHRYNLLSVPFIYFMYIWCVYIVDSPESQSAAISIHVFVRFLIMLLLFIYSILLYAFITLTAFSLLTDWLYLRRSRGDWTVRNNEFNSFDRYYWRMYIWTELNRIPSIQFQANVNYKWCYNDL